MNYSLVPIVTGVLCCHAVMAQTYFMPYAGVDISSTKWQQTTFGIPVDPGYTERFSYGIGLSQTLSDEYHLTFNTTIYSKSHVVWDNGVIATTGIKYNIWDNALVMSRRLNKLFDIGVGFGHRHIYKINLKAVARGEFRADFTLDAIGPVVQVEFNHNSFGVQLKFSHLYNYNGRFERMAFATSNVYEVVGFYRFCIRCNN